MKIGIFISVAKNSGGIYQYTSSILKALHDWDVDHEFVIIKWPGNELPTEDFTGPNWHIVTIDPQLAHCQNVAQYLCGDGLDLEHAGINPEAGEFFKNHGIDLLILPAPVSVSFEWGLPYIMAIHDLQHRLQPEFPEVSAGKIWKSREYLFRNGARFAEAILADSEVGKEDVLNCYGDYITADRVYQLPFLPFYRPDGTEITEAGKQQIQKKYNLPENFLFYPAQFWLHKNHSRLIHAIHKLRVVHKVDTPLVLAGSNSVGLKEEARELVYQNVMILAEQLGVKDLVRHLGYVPDEDMPFLYAMAKALTMPTFFGPSNIPFLEAWAFGCPVIASDIRGIREQIGNAGLLVDPQNAAAMAAGILKIWSDRDLRNDLIHKGFARVNSYTSHDFATKLYTIIENVQCQLQVNSQFSHRNENDKVPTIIENQTDSKSYLVSAIVSTYNAERFIRGRLEDLENQTIADRLEIIIVISGSQQNEEKIIKEFQEKYSNIKYIKTNQRETVYAAWNRGIKASQGRYITNANTDDRLRQDALEVMVNTLEAHPEIALVYADVIITETENETLEHCTPVGLFKWLNFNRADLLNKGCFVGPQPMWRREVHDEYGYFDASLVTSGDYEFWLRISQSHTFLHLPLQLGLYLRSAGGIEHSNRERQRQENHKILDMYQKAQASAEIIGCIQASASSGHTDSRSENMKSPETIYRNIQTEMGNKQPEEVIREMEMLTVSYPEFALAHNDLGVLYYRTGDKEKAQHHYERAVELMPANIIFQKNLADLYCIELGRIEDALRIYVSILKTDPQDVETLMATGQICKALERPDDARDFFNQVLQIEPCNADARKQMEEMESPTAGACLNSESAEDAYRILQEKLNSLTPQEAIVELEKWVEFYPDFAVGHNDLGNLYYNSGSKEKAVPHYRQAAHLQPENMALQKNLADFLFVELGKVEEALQIYVDILAIHPEDLETLLISGHICVALKKFDDAKDFYERVLALEPDHEDAKKNLQILMDRQSERSYVRPDSLNGVTVSSTKDEATDLNTKETENQNAERQTIASIIISLGGIQNRLKQCIESITAHTEEPHEIILINNGATKGILKWAQHLLQDNTHYQLVKCDTSRCRAQGLNQAVKAAAGEYLVLLHNDVVVADRWLSGMLQCFRTRSAIGVVGPMTHAASGIQKVYFSVDRDPNRLESDAKEFYQQNQYRRIPTKKLASFCLMFRRELIDKIGDFDAQLVSEQAVVADFCKRSAAWGFQNLIAGDVFVYHADRHKGNRKTAGTPQVPAEDQKRLKENWNATAGDQGFLKGIQMTSLLETVNELHQMGYINQAVETLLNAIGAIPEEKRLYLALADISISLRRYQDAIDTLNEMPSDAKTAMDSGETGNFNEPGLQSPLSVASENHEMKTLEILGYAQEGLEDFAAAEAYADRMLALDPKSARALNLKGVLAYRRENLNSAEQFFENSIASDPGAGEPYSNLATVKLAAGQEKEAWKLLEKAFILNPTVLEIATNYHTMIAARGEFKRAEDVIHAAASIYPNSQKINYMCIDALLQQGKHDKAMDRIEAAIIKFGIEDGILAAALKVREKLGPMTRQPAKKNAAVSCCLIIKDEEKYLARCLASVKPVVDEMIVVDTGSADRSKDIATAFGAQVYEFEWKKDFAKARNFSLEKASGDWIFILDGDEVISSLDYMHFNRIVKNRPKTPVAYSIVTRNYSALANIVGWVPNDGKYVNEEAAAGWIPSIKTRLFYGKDQIWFEGAVHELVDPVVKRKGFETKQCNIPVHHYGRLHKERLKRKGEIYFEIGKKKMEEMGDDLFAVREMAIQATTLEKNEIALKLWQKLISLDPPELMLADAYINMATLYNRLSDFEQALLVAKKAVAKAPHLKESLYNYALAELHAANAEATIKVLVELINQMPDYPPAHFILSAAYFCIGEKEKGFKIIQELQGTNLGPNLVYPIAELAETLIKAQQNEYALLLLGAAIECDIVNKKILELFNNCIQMRATTIYSPERPRPLALERASVNFGNLPQ